MADEAVSPGVQASGSEPTLVRLSDSARGTDRRGRQASWQHERAFMLGVFYVFYGATAFGSLAVGAWPGTSRLPVALLGVVGLSIGALLRVADPRAPYSTIVALTWAGPLFIAVAQLAVGSPTGAAVYGVFSVFAVAYAVSFLGVAAIVVQLVLVVGTQTFVVHQLGSFAYGDTRGIAAHILVSVAASAGVAAVMWYHTHRRQRAEGHAMAQSQLDALTGLGNRLALLERVERAMRDDGEASALLMVDMAGFRDINDTFGIDVGDQLLRAIAQRLTNVVRADDYLARIGSDEFALLLTVPPNVGIHDVAQQAAVRVQTALRAPFGLNGIALSIEARIGVALAADGSSAEDLLRQADVAADRARDDARSIATVAQIPPRQSRDRLHLLADIRRSLEDGADGADGTGGMLLPYFQPKVDIATGRVIGAEALVRWLHPTRGLVGPGAFLPLVERTSLMRALTARMLDDALHACAAWQHDALALSVAVNVSARDLANPHLVPTVASALEGAGVAATALTIEITETALMNDVAQASDAIRQLRSLGTGVSVDDFGTGWSSLAHLQRLPVTELKIDQSFVADARTDAGAAKIVSATISLGQSLGLRVVAEGVEDAETLEWLAGLHCDQAQGFHLGRPMPPADLAAFARAHVPRPAPSMSAEVAE